MNNNNPHAAHDTRYEWKTVLLLALGFGLVGLDRWILAPLFPAMMQDLQLSYSQLGTLVGAMVPSSLLDELHLEPATMGFVLSAMGRGGFLGEFAISGLSDIIGRRTATVLAFIGAAIGTWFFFHAPANAALLFTWLAVTAFFGLGLASILTGPIPTEAVSHV
ncbi:MFS transporter [Pseudomonas gingeri]|uniref:MFS transporter n=1 Tax=Pseudomonas gingeri TaxID=117681 RepID=UPI001C43131C|nr:MFS transporter [Pseudomonas gingeri]